MRQLDIDKLDKDILDRLSNDTELITTIASWITSPDYTLFPSLHICHSSLSNYNKPY